MAPPPLLLKLVLVGESGVGKTALLRRLQGGGFRGDEGAYTVGCDISVLSLQVGGRAVRVQVWDTAGQERFRAITRPLYRGAHAALLMFDAGDRASFLSLPAWLDEVRTHCSAAARLFLVAGKADLRDRRQVSTYDAMRFARDRRLPLFETSAKDGRQVAETFEAVVTSLVLDAEDAGAGDVRRQPCSAFGLDQPPAPAPDRLLRWWRTHCALL